MKESIKAQIEFYQQLSEVEKYIIKAVAIRAEVNHPAEITELLQTRIKLTQKSVNECVEKAVAVIDQ